MGLTKYQNHAEEPRTTLLSTISGYTGQEENPRCVAGLVTGSVG